MNKYTSLIESKTGLTVPCSGTQALHSKYDPAHEAEQFVSSIAQSHYFVVYGIAGGYHIASLLQKYPDSHILAIECDNDAIQFLSHIPCVRSLLADKRIEAIPVSSVQQNFISSYIPALYGSVSIIELRSWIHAFPESYESAKAVVTKSLAEISADYSVQCHFGKIWQRAIFQNLRQAGSIKTNSIPSFDTKKTAAVIAAGPSLNDSIHELINHRNDYVIFATDTSYSTLCDSHIVPDIVVSVDGQFVSHCHFMHNVSRETLFVFDLCANNSAVRFIASTGAPLLFIESGHPLARYASQSGSCSSNPSFLHLDTGSGTVTIAAASFAQALSFTKITFFGADFAYSSKPYSRGTYLDVLYNTASRRTRPSETVFDSLMYRTPLLPSQKKGWKTTSVLDSYRITLEQFLQQNNFEKKDSDTYLSRIIKKPQSTSAFNYQKFISSYTSSLEKLFSDADILSSHDPALYTLLPFAANLSASAFKNKSKTDNDPLHFLKLAYSKTLRYTGGI